MSINRFLSRRDKSRDKSKDKSKTPRESVATKNIHFYGSFAETDPKASDRDEQKIKGIQKLLCEEEVGTFDDEDVGYALGLPYTNGDTQKTLELLKFLQDSQDLLVTHYDPKVKFLGAVNRRNVTCYLDSLLFAMFGCQDNYEPMLVNRFGDKKKDRLATLLRLWVNMQRSGKLVTTDITKQIQDALAACGWREAAEAKQQDAGEAFTFITEQLGLPNLYLKMDLFHHGKEDAKDDHKIVQERLLEMPVPDPTEERSTVTLEDCAEAALNAKVEVRRFLEGRQRRNTAGSTKSFESSKGATVHVESVEVNGSEPTTPTSGRAPSPALQNEPPKRSLTLLQRTPSIIQENIVHDGQSEDIEKGGLTRSRVGTRKEVMIPAWQMYSLIPFHTGYSPENDAQVAHHFKLKQPIFGIRLKRYGFNKSGKPVRKETRIDIPVDMAFPSFIHDDGPGSGSETDFNGLRKFKLALQSAVCHRGNSTESGHYVSIARGRAANGEDRWLLWDDLSSTERVREVNVMDALKKETPYLLFYQVQPIDGSDGLKPPRSISSVDRDSGIAGLSSTSSAEQRNGNGNESSRPSFDETSSVEDHRVKIKSMDERRPSVALTDESAGNGDEAQRKSHRPSTSLTVDASEVPPRSSSATRKSESKSRPPSSGNQKRLSTSLSRLTGGRSSETIDRTLSGLLPNEPSKPGANTMAEIVIAAQVKEKAKVKRKEEKSKNRLSVHLRPKNNTAPDRECAMM